MVTCCRLLRIRSSLLDVRSWLGNNVPVTLYQLNVILCPDKKGQSLKAQQLSPSKVPVWLRGGRSQLAAPFTACPALIPEGARHPTNWSSVSSGSPNGETRFPRLTRQKATAIRLQRQGWRKRFTAASRPGPQPVEGLSKGYGALQDTVPSLFPGPSSSPAGPRLGRLEGLQEKA